MPGVPRPPVVEQGDEPVGGVGQRRGAGRRRDGTGLTGEPGRLATAPRPGRGLREVQPGPGGFPEPVPGPPRLGRQLQGLVRCRHVAAGEEDEAPAVADHGQHAGDGPGGEHRADPVRPGLRGVHVATRQVRPHAGEQVREQVGGVGDAGRGLVAALAERERGVVVTLAPCGFGQSPQRRRQPLQLGHLLSLGGRLPQQAGGCLPLAAPHRQVAQARTAR